MTLSDAIDLASPKLVQHQQRTAFIAWQMAKTARLPLKRIEQLFVASLIHDVGAISLEEKVALHESETEETEPHCQRGMLLLGKVSWFREAASLVRFHHTEWQKWDEPITAPLVTDSQIILLADLVERSIRRDQYILHQDNRLRSVAIAAAGTLVHPDLVDLFLQTADREEFWLDLTSPRLYALLLHYGLYREVEVDIEAISAITDFLRTLVDFRSRFTATHSAGVAACAEFLSRMFGFIESEVQLMKIAGDLHDLGKLNVPNSILEKKGKLSAEEFAVVRSHTYHTYSLLTTIRGLEHIAKWAAYHHERLDGSGYPFHCKADEIDTGARIMAVADLFTALAEDRPYRKGMSKPEATKIVRSLADRGLLDERVVNLLLSNYGEVHSYVREKQEESREFYENQIATLDESLDPAICSPA